jgi:anti-sigma B factor antagonist
MIQFSFDITEKDNVVIFHFKGSLMESDNGTLLLAAADDYIKKGKTNFVLCLSDFVYMTSSGLSIIINMLTRARKNNGDAVICSINSKTDEVLAITKLNNVFKVFADADEAVNYFKQTI